MAYKFQLGAARLSGSVIHEGGITAESSALSGSELNIGEAHMSEADLEKLDQITDGTAAANKALVADANVDISGLRNITGTGNITAGGSFIIGSADLDETDLEKLDGITDGTVAANKAVVADGNLDFSGFRNISGSGVLRSTSAIFEGTLSLNNGGVSISAAELNVLDSVTAGTAAASKAVVLDADKNLATLNMLTASFISASSIQTTDLTVAANTLTVGSTSISESEITFLDSVTAGTVAADKAVVVDSNKDAGDFRNLLLTGKLGTATDQETIDFGTSNEVNININDAVVLSIKNNMVSASVNLAAGGDVQVPVGKGYDVESAGALLIGESVGANNLTLGGASSTVVIPGNLTVEGSAVEIQQGFVVTASVQFEGSIPDGNELTLTTANPTADRTVTIPDLSGHIPILVDAVGNNNVTAAEFGLLNSGSSVVTATVGDGDAVLFNEAGVGMKHINVTSLKTYFQSGVTADTAQGLRLTGADTMVSTIGTISNDVTLVGATASLSLTMPDITDSLVGRLYLIKDAAGNAGTNNITINQSTSGHDIDGADNPTAIVLESDSAAVQLLACSGSNGFFYAVF